MEKQIIKCREDTIPVFFENIDESNLFKLFESSKCTWVKAGEEFGPEKLRHRIEPWLTALVQSEHLSLLVGSGLTHAVHKLATGEILPGMSSFAFKNLNDEIKKEASRTAEIAGRKEGNFEDQIRVATELLRGLEIIASTKSEGAVEYEQVSELQTDLAEALNTFADSILKGEQGLISADVEKRELAFNYLVSFLMSFASRSGTRERLQLFTTNYDRYIELGADTAGLNLLTDL